MKRFMLAAALPLAIAAAPPPAPPPTISVTLTADQIQKLDTAVAIAASVCGNRAVPGNKDGCVVGYSADDLHKALADGFNRLSMTEAKH